MTQYIKIQLTDTTIINYPNTDGYLFQNWLIKSTDKNNTSKIEDFIKSSKTYSRTGYSGTTSLPPIGGDTFMYIETSSNNNGNNVFVSFERIDIIQISNLTFYYKRFSVLIDDFKKSICIFRSQFLLEDNTWSTQYTIAKNDQYSENSTDWTLLNLNFTVEKYGIKLIYDQIDAAYADMCFSNITITKSVYHLDLQIFIS